MTLLSTIKNWFKTGKIPTQTQFWALFDSFWHKSEEIPAAKIENLQDLLDDKADRATLEHHHSDPNAHQNIFDDLLLAGKFKEALNTLDIYTEYRRTGFGTSDPQATLDVFGTFNVSSDDASGATINTIHNESFYIGSTDIDNKLQLLLNINGTAELPNSTAALIAARGGKAIVTKEYLDTISLGSAAQIISNQFYFGSSFSNNDVWMIGHHSTSNQSGGLYPNSSSLSTILETKYAANIPAGLQVIDKGRKLTKIDFIISLAQGTLSDIRLVVFAKKYTDGDSYSIISDYLILYDGIVNIGTLSNTTITKEIILNSPIIPDDGYHVNYMLYKTTSFRGQPGLINLKFV